MTENERNLLAGCIRGDKASWDEFVSQYSALIYHTIKKTFSFYHTESRSDLVADLYQEVFVTLLRDDFKKLRQFKGENDCTVATWLRVLTARLTVDFLRKQKARPVGFEKDPPIDHSDIVASFIGREEEKSLAHAIDDLPPRDRLLIELCFGRGLPPEDIAHMFKVSVGAVYTHKSRLLAKLRAILQKSGSL
jgi:RNA polymerase sigma-70 factor (ECF subfamily)